MPDLKLRNSSATGAEMMGWLPCKSRRALAEPTTATKTLLAGSNEMYLTGAACLPEVTAGNLYDDAASGTKKAKFTPSAPTPPLESMSSSKYMVPVAVIVLWGVAAIDCAATNSIARPKKIFMAADACI